MAVATAVVPLQGKVDAVKPYVCQVCARSYERQDHLSRHLDSRGLTPKPCSLKPC